MEATYSASAPVPVRMRRATAAARAVTMASMTQEPYEPTRSSWRIPNRPAGVMASTHDPGPSARQAAGAVSCGHLETERWCTRTVPDGGARLDR